MWFWDLLGNILGIVVLVGLALFAVLLVLGAIIAASWGIGNALIYKPFLTALGVTNDWLDRRGISFRLCEMDGIVFGALFLFLAFAAVSFIW